MNLENPPAMQPDNRKTGKVLGKLMLNNCKIIFKRVFIFKITGKARFSGENNGLFYSGFSYQIVEKNHFYQLKCSNKRLLVYWFIEDMRIKWRKTIIGLEFISKCSQNVWKVYYLYPFSNA